MSSSNHFFQNGPRRLSAKQLDIDAKHSNEDVIAPFDEWIPRQIFGAQEKLSIAGLTVLGRLVPSNPTTNLPDPSPSVAGPLA